MVINDNVSTASGAMYIYNGYTGIAGYNTNIITTTTSTAGTNTIMPYYWEDFKVTPTAIEIAEALFVIKPGLRKKYKDCAADLVTDIIAAADGKKSWNAAKKLGTVLGLED